MRRAARERGPGRKTPKERRRRKKDSAKQNWESVRAPSIVSAMHGHNETMADIFVLLSRSVPLPT